MSKAARRGRLFVDYFRNGGGAIAVAAYSTCESECADLDAARLE